MEEKEEQMANFAWEQTVNLSFPAPNFHISQFPLN